MADLSDKQINFLSEQNIPVYKVYDATGMSKASYRSVMKSLGKEFAYGVSPCKKYGHTLRTRAGHCIQCDTSKIAYQLRYNEDGWVYIAHSDSEKIFKVGVAKDIDDRLRNLNSQGYGGTKDWNVVGYRRFDEAGMVEMQIHRQLSNFQTVRTYYKTGCYVECRELFSCDVRIAVELLESIE